ncbi:MAG: hypothetical protein RM049_27865 [Nostoc sp. DedQUE04]|uniref:TRADD-N-associated membrane domain-containing protein n=1 Tax=Nostoc sp. DedQUE04 TaxID=3075390 RepID=UPI002AD272EF|nr:hypothetical protein [Nostoc sp. DedQUE04]MDZ8139053.1 hypothetical protein [Nostoc sp. DedQUE04]
MNQDNPKENLSLQRLRQRRLFGLLTIFISILIVATRQQFSSVWEISNQVLGSFITNIFLILPYIMLCVGIYLYFQTEQIGSKLEEKAYLFAQAKHIEEPGKAKPVWDMAQITLESYFNRNLSQIRWIFWLSIAVMSLGFSLILYGVVLGYQHPKDNWIVAGIGGIAGVLTEFIGATFLFVYKSSMQQANNYTEILERMNFVGMAMQMLDSIAESNRNSTSASGTDFIDPLREAKIEMAKVLLNKFQINSSQNKTD